MIAFIDTEVSFQNKQAKDFGVVREDGAVLHTHSLDEFQKFVYDCEYICGHNIIKFDLKYSSIKGKHTYIDTLPLSPLLFPNKPYHRLVKDDKLQVEELNNPVNDAKKAKDLFFDEAEAWKHLTEQKQEILYQLLHDKPEFSGFFKYVGYSPQTQSSLFGRLISSKPDISSLIITEYHGKICGNVNISKLTNSYPVELAYALAVIGADDIMSITPSWVQRNYPHMASVMNLLRNTPCGECEYCRNQLDAHKGLQEFFGYNEFRLFDGKKMQQEAVEAAIRSESILTIFPTGGGKSLTFQLPALMAGRNTHGLTVVISPLQSLMKDQVDNLAERGISDAVTINGLLDPIERASAVQQVADGSANLLYIAPEMLRSKTIERLLLGRNVVRFVIDEAHCFSAWGQDFRVDYLYIGDFIRRLQELKQQQQPIAVSCFTATAKQKVITDICDYFMQKLNLNLKIFAANSERKNLHYTVIHSDTDDDKYNQLRSLILGHNCPSIIYVSRTKRTKELSDHLRADGIRALPFNGKMEAADKIRNQDAFMNGEAQVIVATSAFGMGVDKKDVGLVIHYDISDSLESYIQEAGRAGRDPHMEADCYVLYADSDLDKHFILLNQTKLSISEIQQVWRAIKDMTQQRPTVSCSPLEIARKAGWGDEVDDVETRIKAAIAALEDAGFIERGSNAPHVFATGITVGNMDEARRRITRSSLFDDTTREEAVRIISSLISRRATQQNNDEAESRIDYLADVLGMSKESVIRNVNLMRQEGILADSQDMLAGLPKSNTMRELKNTLQLERFLLTKLTDKTRELNYKELNEEAQSQGMSFCNVKRIKTLLYFLRLKGYVRKEEHTAAGSVSLRLQVDSDATMQHFERRAGLCQFVVETISTQKIEKDSSFVPFSLVGLLNQYNTSQLSLSDPPTLSDMEEALLFLSKNELLKIEGGFLVIYNTMQLSRKVERKARYTKENYRLLDEFYKQRIQQIHIVGEYANLMVRDYDTALQYVSDYFTMDYRRFINKYFKEDRKTEINQNITPAKYKKIFGTLSTRQLEIINDKESRYIVVAAGPGSGKTRVLVHKLASLLLLEDVKHEQLLMLTFSRAAATEFKKRLIELVGNAAHFVDIKTFHSYSFDLLGKQGSLEEADSVVQRAAEMIENGEVETAKIAKSVLVIDEAQDMGPDDYRLVRALMQRNEEMRVIAVGDDDQNIYAFRGSDSKYLHSLVVDHNATLYEMTDNYRSAQEIVNQANRFVRRIPNRMKHTPIKAVTTDEGVVKIIPNDAKFVIQRSAINGSTAILTRTNEQALQVAYQLEQHGIRALLVQSGSGFRFINLAEVRYFVKYLGDEGSVISKDVWEAAKERTCQNYATSRLLPAMRHFWEDYEQINRTIYRSDLRQFLLESDVEDFVSFDNNSVFVSTIHKAKGREFDTVHLFVSEPNTTDPDDLRTIYVGLTRARRTLYIYNKPVLDQTNISISLNLHDVWLDYFKERKDKVLRLRSGDGLKYSNGYLISQQGDYIACLSKARKQQMEELFQKGYHVISTQVSYILAWRPREEPQEVAVCLANIILQK
ncbi:MAG: RecQ family ATP-dependent DNA helicase [Bacteroidales bacterium]|nr:RecQ family ATP-dependent DNA helicase [Bacteroidales bacterium]